MFLLLAALVANLGFVYCRLLSTPLSRAVVVGQNISFECRFDDGWRLNKWEVTKESVTNSSVEVNTVMAFVNGTAKFSPNFTHFHANVDRNGSGLIYADSIKLEDAGNYTCQSGGETFFKYSAQLVVFESFPKCTENETVNGIEMACRVNFRGFCFPTMEWRQHFVVESEEGQRPLVKDDFLPEINLNAVTSTILVRKGSIKRPLFYSCRTYFVRSNQNNFTMNATSEPDFEYIWNSSVFPISPFPVSESPSTPRTEIRNGLFIVVIVSSLAVLLLLVILFAGAIVCYKSMKKNRRRTDRPGDTCTSTMNRNHEQEGTYNEIGYPTADTINTMKKITEPVYSEVNDPDLGLIEKPPIVAVPNPTSCTNPFYHPAFALPHTEPQTGGISPPPPFYHELTPTACTQSTVGHVYADQTTGNPQSDFNVSNAAADPSSLHRPLIREIYESASEIGMEGNRTNTASKPLF